MTSVINILSTLLLITTGNGASSLPYSYSYTAQTLIILRAIAILRSKN